MRRIVENIRRLKQRCAIEEEIVQDLDLTPREMGSLLALSAGERMGCNELAGRVGLSPSRASRVIGRLIDKGYLFRAENGRDRRCIFLSLTARGEECRRQILQAEEACARRILSRLSADQARKVEEGIEILLEVL